MALMLLSLALVTVLALPHRQLRRPTGVVLLAAMAVGDHPLVLRAHSATSPADAPVFSGRGRAGQGIGLGPAMGLARTARPLG